MRAAGSHGRKIKFRSSGRHSTPSHLVRVARQVGRAAPAIAVLGALTAAPPTGAGGPRPATPVTAGLTVAGRPATGIIAAPAGFGTPAGQLNRARLIRPGQASVTPPHHSRPPRRRPRAERKPRAAATPLPAPAATTPAAPAATTPAAPQVPACTGTSGMLPANYAAIVDFLTAHGYTGLAAAGIAGNIYQESGGNPESVGTGGGGLIGWTPLPPGFVTGNPAADLQTQLQAILTFNQQWSQYIPALNAAATATQAADIYMNDFERPGFPAAGNREAAASAVAAACGL